MTDTQPRPFDERSALEELERLAERIQATRRQRERAVAEFNAFVKTFKDEDHAARLSALQAVVRPEPAHVLAPPVPSPAPALSATSASPSTPPLPPVPPSAPLVERRAAEPAPVAVAEPPAEPAQTKEKDPEAVATSWSAPAHGFDLQSLWNTPRGRIGLAAAALLVVVLFASWLLRGGQQESPVTENPSPSAAQSQAQAAPQPSSGPAAAPTPVASTGAPRAINVVLMTSRPVWTRVTVDDRKVIERELAGAQTIPLGADRTIAIRAGDAGAVRLIVDGKDLGVMGRDGQIASRTFTAPAAR